MMKLALRIGSVVAGIAVLVVLYEVFFVPPKVLTGTVTRGDLVTLVYATARVSADSLATLRSTSGGVVVEVLCREGEHVRQGALMLRTDPGDQQLRLQNSRNALSAAEVHLADRDRDRVRQRNLLQSGTATQAAFDDAQREYDLARITVERERINVGLSSRSLHDTQVRAPFTGIVISATARQGDLLSVNGECFRLMAPGSLTIEADVAEQDIARLSPGQKCLVAFDAYPQQRYSGTLTRLVPLTDEDTKTSRAIIHIDHQPDDLTIGMTVTVNVITEELRNVLLLPQAALSDTAGQKHVFAVIDGRAKLIAVATGTSNGTVAHLTGPPELRESTLVVLAPGSGLGDGVKVRTE